MSSSQSLPNVPVVKEIGIKLTESLTFKDHINIIVFKTVKMNDLIKRVCTSFTNAQALRSLHNLLS